MSQRMCSLIMASMTMRMARWMRLRSMVPNISATARRVKRGPKASPAQLAKTVKMVPPVPRDLKVSPVPMAKTARKVPKVSPVRMAKTVKTARKVLKVSLRMAKTVQTVQTVPGPQGEPVDGQDGRWCARSPRRARADGQDGQDGAQGPQGEPGADGQDGQDGEDGSDCTVAQTDCQATLSCEDGTSVSWELYGCSCDNCGVCDFDTDNDCTRDCFGTWGEQLWSILVGSVVLILPMTAFRIVLAPGVARRMG